MGDGRRRLRGYGRLQAVGTVGVGILWCLIERLRSAHPTAGFFLGSEGIFPPLLRLSYPSQPGSTGVQCPISLLQRGFIAHLPFFWGGGRGRSLIFQLPVVFSAQLWLRMPSAIDGLRSLGHVP